MKIRQGFVSNSSSASFIIRFKSSRSYKDVVDMVRKSDEWLDKRWDETEKEEWDWEAGVANVIKDIKRKKVKITPIGKYYIKQNGKFLEIHPDTTMMNDWMDIPAWPFIRALSENRIPGLELDSITQTYDEHSECNQPAEFDHISWEYDSAIVNPWGDKEPDKNEVDKAVKHQQEIDYEYMTYLSNIDSPLTEQEQKNLAKNHLTKM